MHRTRDLAIRQVAALIQNVWQNVCFNCQNKFSPMLLKATMPKTHKAGGAGRLYTIDIDSRLSLVL